MKTFYEAIIAQGGFAGQVFDVAAGPANTDIIDVLLSAGDGSLTGNAPVNVISTGALGAARSLDISGVEQNGRFFYLSVRNSDLNSNSLTITPTTSINGSATLVLTAPADYIFVHESGGVWRAYYQFQTASTSTSVFRATFLSAVWSAGTANQITIIRTGSPGAGQIGPHNLPLASSYVVQVFRDSDNTLVDTGAKVDPVTGNVTLSKTGLGAAFNGRVILVG
jgi:hypothetical protein